MKKLIHPGTFGTSTDQSLIFCMHTLPLQRKSTERLYTLFQMQHCKRHTHTHTLSWISTQNPCNIYRCQISQPGDSLRGWLAGVGG